MELVIKGDVFDGKEFFENGIVVVDQEEGVIREAGRESEVDQPAGAKVVGGEGMTVMPGLIDTHLHFFGSRAYDLGTWVGVPETLAVLRSIPQLKALLNAGFTTVRDMGSKGGAFLSRGVREGLIEGPTVLSCGHSLGQTGGDDDPTNLPLHIAQELSYSYFGDGPWELRKAVRKVLREGADFVKVYAATGSTPAGFSSPTRVQLTVEELKAIVDEAHRAGIKVAGHAIGEASLANVIEAGVDSIEHGMDLTPELAAQIKKKGIFYCPTLGIFLTSPRFAAVIDDPNAEDPYNIRRHVNSDMQLAKEYELDVVSGTDFGGTDAQPHGGNHIEIGAIAKHLGNKGAIISATSRAATCSGLTSVGQIKGGFDADIIVVRGNPLKDIEALAPTNVTAVFKKGKQFKGN